MSFVAKPKRLRGERLRGKALREAVHALANAVVRAFLHPIAQTDDRVSSLVSKVKRHTGHGREAEIRRDIDAGWAIGERLSRMGEIAAELDALTREHPKWAESANRVLAALRPVRAMMRRSKGRPVDIVWCRRRALVLESQEYETWPHQVLAALSILAEIRDLKPDNDRTPKQVLRLEVAALRNMRDRAAFRRAQRNTT
jgi:hypothetical protein